MVQSIAKTGYQLDHKLLFYQLGTQVARRISRNPVLASINFAATALIEEFHRASGLLLASLLSIALSWPTCKCIVLWVSDITQFGNISSYTSIKKILLWMMNRSFGYYLLCGLVYIFREQNILPRSLMHCFVFYMVFLEGVLAWCSWRTVVVHQWLNECKGIWIFIFVELRSP